MPAALGENQEWIARVTNNGPFTARAVVTTVTIPETVTFVWASGGVTPVANVLTFLMELLAPGDTALYYIVVTLDSPGSIEVSANITSDTMDPMPANNDATLTQVVV